MGAALPVIGSVAAVIVTALLAPWMARNAARNEADRIKNEENERRANSAESSQIVRLFAEQDQMRDQYRQDIASHRAEIVELRQRIADSDSRVRALEQEVAEWRAGVRGVHGVWIAVPASVWTYVRERLPELPPTPFPGERDRDDLPPAAI